MALAHHRRIRRPGLHIEHLAQALVHEHVLAPLTEVLPGDALLRGLAIPAALVVLCKGVDGSTLFVLKLDAHHIVSYYLTIGNPHDSVTG